MITQLGPNNRITIHKIRPGALYPAVVDTEDGEGVDWKYWHPWGGYPFPLYYLTNDGKLLWCLYYGNRNPYSHWTMCATRDRAIRELNDRFREGSLVF